MSRPQGFMMWIALRLVRIWRLRAIFRINLLLVDDKVIKMYVLSHLFIICGRSVRSVALDNNVFSKIHFKNLSFCEVYV